MSAEPAAAGEGPSKAILFSGPAKCCHVRVGVLHKRILYTPQDEQASAPWSWARECLDCGAIIWGDDIL